jgi:hypothetical protein
MAIVDCALSGPGLAFMFCVARIRELEAVRKVSPPIECVSRAPTPTEGATKPAAESKECPDRDLRQGK